jgi:hypothetical protein
MASAWVERRKTPTGKSRYLVRFMLGGARTRKRYAGSFKTMREARAREQWVAGELAALRVPDLTILAEPPLAPTLAEEAKRWQASRATQRLYQEYERFDRPAAYRQNQIRRWILEQVGELDAKAKAGGLIQFRPDENDPYPPAEQYIAARVLAYENCLEMPDEGKPAWFTVKFGTQGYEALHDEQLMRRLFPVSVTDDEEAQIPVAPDVLQSVITSCEQLLETLGWRQAQVELTRGDKEYRDKDWVNATREYYAAVESGLKYALGLEQEAEEDDRRALNKLAGEAGRAGLIPANYAQLFGYLDSIRSPRSHGGGRRAENVGEIPVGQAEALLLANHARSLLVYLGQRSSATRTPESGSEPSSP